MLKRDSHTKPDMVQRGHRRDSRSGLYEGIVLGITPR
ncbi:hypothetical protein FMEAI12_5100045 [Parafrankia sp. Ea1.12]|nr:hypothetical protein FMEAI12_5100045 [Parafrankia sp. Ea1.12]